MAGPVDIGLSAAGGIVNAFGTAMKDDSQAAMYQYKAGVAKANAVYAQQNADYAFEEGGVKEQLAGLEGGQKVGQIRVAQAASGLDVNSGTGKDVVASEIKGIQEQEGIISYDAAKKAYGYSIQAADFQNEAQFDTMASSNIEKQKWFDVAGSILGGATSVADKWSKFKTAGISLGGGSLTPA